MGFVHQGFDEMQAKPAYLTFSHHRIHIRVRGFGEWVEWLAAVANHDGNGVGVG